MSTVAEDVRKRIEDRLAEIDRFEGEAVAQIARLRAERIELCALIGLRTERMTANGGTFRSKKSALIHAFSDGQPHRFRDVMIAVGYAGKTINGGASTLRMRSGRQFERVSHGVYRMLPEVKS